MPAGKTATTGAFTWSGGNAGGGIVNPTPEPSGPPSASPSASPSVSPSASPSVSPSASPSGPPVTSNRLFVRSGGVLSPTAGSGATTVTLPAANGNWDGTPHNQQTFTLCGLRGATAGATTFALHLDAGSAVGAGIQARVSYDYTGSGTWSRTETYNYFATDPVPGTENYTQATGVRASTGSMAAMNGGCARLELWNAIGNAPTTVRVDATSAQSNQSTVTIPFTLS